MNSWQLASINCLERLPAEALAALRGESRVKKLKHGSLVFSPDPEPGLVYLLEDGVCRIFRTTRQGSEFTLGMVLKGEIFGELGVVCNQPRTGFAVAQCDSVIWQFPRETFARMMQSCPVFPDDNKAADGQAGQDRTAGRGSGFSFGSIASGAYFAYS